MHFRATSIESQESERICLNCCSQCEDELTCKVFDSVCVCVHHRRTPWNVMTEEIEGDIEDSSLKTQSVILWTKQYVRLTGNKNHG